MNNNCYLQFERARIEANISGDSIDVYCSDTTENCKFTWDILKSRAWYHSLRNSYGELQGIFAYKHDKSICMPK